jgi:hypothetical protein
MDNATKFTIIAAGCVLIGLSTFIIWRKLRETESFMFIPGYAHAKAYENFFKHWFSLSLGFIGALLIVGTLLSSFEKPLETLSTTSSSSQLVTGERLPTISKEDLSNVEIAKTPTSEDKDAVTSAYATSEPITTPATTVTLSNLLEKAESVKVDYAPPIDRPKFGKTFWGLTFGDNFSEVQKSIQANFKLEEGFFRINKTTLLRLLGKNTLEGLEVVLYLSNKDEFDQIVITLDKTYQYIGNFDNGQVWRSDVNGQTVNIVLAKVLERDGYKVTMTYQRLE